MIDCTREKKGFDEISKKLGKRYRRAESTGNKRGRCSPMITNDTPTYEVSPKGK